MALNKIELLDLDGNVETTGLFEDRAVVAMAVEVATRQTKHILEKRIHNYYTPEDAIAMAYLQGRFDVELEDEQAKLEAEELASVGCTRGPDQVIKPKKCNKKCH